MRPEDWKFVRGTWDLFEKFRDPVDQLQRRTSGVGIEYVPGRSVDTPRGAIEGKYFPLVYDATKSIVAERNLERSQGALFESQYHRVMTRNGSVIARVSGVKLPIDLSFDIIPWKITQTIHDLAFREAIMQSDRILSDKRVMSAIDDTFGPETSGAMRPWLQHVATSRTRTIVRWDSGTNFSIEHAPMPRWLALHSDPLQRRCTPYRRYRIRLGNLEVSTR